MLPISACPTCTAPQDCVLADGSVQADTEATVLAAFCCWVESVPAGDQARRDTDERVAAILSRIRLPAISPPLLHCFWAQFAFLRRWDRDGQILLRAVRHAVSGYRRHVQSCAVRCTCGCDPLGVVAHAWALNSRMLPAHHPSRRRPARPLIGHCWKPGRRRRQMWVTRTRTETPINAPPPPSRPSAAAGGRRGSRRWAASCCRRPLMWRCAARGLKGGL